MEFYDFIPDSHERFQLSLDGRQVQMWTAQPGFITKISDLAGKITVDVQPTIQARIRWPDGSLHTTQLPIIPDVPVVFPRGGGYVHTFPMAVNDEVLIVHAARNIDGWWQNGGIQPPLDSRLHDLTDAFVVPGPYSQATKFSGLSTTTAQFRTEDGTLYVEVDKPNKKIRLVSNSIYIEVDSNNNDVIVNGADTVFVTANNSVNVTAPTTVVHGDLHVTGSVIAGFGGGDQVGLQTHIHGNTGSAATRTVVPTPGT